MILNSSEIKAFEQKEYKVKKKFFFSSAICRRKMYN